MDHHTVPHCVKVGGETHEIWVGHRKKAVWLAYGEFAGKRVNATGRSASLAAREWKRLVEKI
jgi:hypothetical protein